jgi:hypothetical protein
MSGNRCWFCHRNEEEVEDEIGKVTLEGGKAAKNMFHVIANKDYKDMPNVPLYFCRACGIIIDHLSNVAIKRTKS